MSELHARSEWAGGLVDENKRLRAELDASLTENERLQSHLDTAYARVARLRADLARPEKWDFK